MEITISENAYIPLMQNVGEKSTQTVQQVAEGDLDQLKASAKRFQSVIKNYRRNVEALEEIVKDQNRLLNQVQQSLQSDDRIGQLISQYQKNQQTITNYVVRRSIGEAFEEQYLNFERDINSFMGQTMHLAFVITPKANSQSRSPTVYLDVPNIAQYLRYEFTGKELMPRIRSATLKDIERAGVQPYQIQEDHTNLDNAYNTILDRYYKYHGHVIAGSGSQQVFASIHNRGVINEGYGRAVFLEQAAGFQKISDPEEQALFFLVNYVIPSDNAPGLVIGDIAKGIGESQYAIKGLNAQLISISQAEQYISFILQDSFSKEKMEAKIQSDIDKSSLLVTLEEGAIDNVKDIALQYAQQYDLEYNWT